MKNKGFTLIELIIVISVIGILMGVFPVIFDDYIEDRKLESGINKIRYDIIYLQNLKFSSTENYMIKFKKEGDSVQVIGKEGVDFDYVCYNDKDGDHEPKYSSNEEENEIIIDPLTKKYMMYDFDNPQYTTRELEELSLKEVKFYNENDGANTVLWFDKIGEFKVYEDVNDTNSDWVSMKYFENESGNYNHITLEKNLEIDLILYPLTTDMKIIR
ncbi:MAG: pilus assembly FimT family protein [Fusobacteriota bacterium]